MRIDILHTTRFEYDREIQPQSHLLYLRPRENPLLQVNQFELAFTPGARVHWMRDDFDNMLASAHFSEGTSMLEIRSNCSVTTSDLEPFDFLVRDYARSYPFAYEPLHYFNLAIYFAAEHASAQAPLRRWLAERFQDPPQDTVAWLFALNRTVHQHLEYRPRQEPGIQQALTTLELGTGSCRDYAAFLIECARALGIAARFVSGYMADLTPGAPEGSSMHAWVEVFLPGAGWRGLDPTHGIFCDSSYVPVAHAVVAESVNPVQGSFQGEASVVARLTADVRVSPAPDDPEAAVPTERWPAAS